MKFLKIITFLWFFSLKLLWGLDVKNIPPEQVIGGFPENSSSVKNRSKHVPYKYKNKRGVPLDEMYKGSSHEKALDLQIQKYRSKALKNILAFGGYTQKWLAKDDYKKLISDITEPRDLREEFNVLQEKGEISIKFKKGDTWAIMIEVLEGASP